MLEPQSTFLFILLLAGFGVLMWRMVKSRRVLTRVVASVTAFVLAVQFGIMAVNRYFDYYQTWGAAIADMTSSGPATGPVSDSSLLAKSWRNALSGHDVYLGLAMREGYTLRLRLTGQLSHITREVYAYLPPQYFQPGYGHYRFPVVELIHGQPGVPQDWINVVGVIATMDDLVNRGLAKPAVLVMPDANGGQRISLQCLNQHDGPQDMTYLGLDVPNGISRMLRVQPPGLGWGLAGYSEGGFCAANMALQPDLRRRYGMAASLSGYFSPFKNLLADGQAVDPFGGNKALRRENTPLAVLENLSPGSPIPQFWLGADKGDKTDVAAAEYFWQELQIYQANVPLVLMPGQHTMAVWRAEVSPMLEWMTDGLASAVAKLALNVRLASKHAPQCAKLPAVRSKLAAHARRDPSTRSRAGHSVRSTSPAACRRTLPSRAKFQVKHQTQASAIARANAQTRT